MKRHQKRHRSNFERDIKVKRRREQNGGFKCVSCREQVVLNAFMGTANRNHCNMCLWSRHVDEKKGDRKALCQARMQPIGLTFRIESHDRMGEIMLIHVCSGCPKISINRIAADDLDSEIMAVFRRSFELNTALKQRVLGSGVSFALKSDTRVIMTQLYGTR